MHKFLGPAVGVCVLVIVLLAGLYRHAAGNPWWLAKRFVGLAVFTAIIVGFTLWEFRRYYWRFKFWVVMMFLLGVHLTAFMMLLLTVNDLRAIWFGIIITVE